MTKNGLYPIASIVLNASLRSALNTLRSMFALNDWRRKSRSPAFRSEAFFLSAFVQCSRKKTVSGGLIRARSDGGGCLNSFQYDVVRGFCCLLVLVSTGLTSFLYHFRGMRHRII